MAFPERNLEEHPTAEDLCSYYQDQLPERHHLEIQNHLVECRECADLLLELDDLFQVSVEDPSPAEKPKLVNASLGSRSRQHATESRANRGGRPRWSDFRSRRSFWAAAAGVVLAIGATFLLDGPSDVPSRSVTLGPSVRGGSGEAPLLDLSLGAVHLHIGTQEAGPFEVELVASTGKTLQTFEKVEPRDGEVTVTVEDLPPGSYRVLLITKHSQGGAGETVEDLAIRVAQEP